MQEFPERKDKEKYIQLSVVIYRGPMQHDIAYSILVAIVEAEMSQNLGWRD